MNEKINYVTYRECEVIKDTINNNINIINKRIQILEDRIWLIITLLLGNMIGIMTIFFTIIHK